MLDGLTAKFIDNGFACILAEGSANLLPAKYSKFNFQCPISEMGTMLKLKGSGGKHFRTMGCEAGYPGGTPTFTAPLRHFTMRQDVSSSSFDKLLAAMAGGPEDAELLREMTKNYAVSPGAKPYVLSWEQARSYDMFSLGIMATQLLTGTQAGMHAALLYGCDGTIEGAEICSDMMICSWPAGAMNTRLAKWLALDNHRCVKHFPHAFVDRDSFPAASHSCCEC